MLQRMVYSKFQLADPARAAEFIEQAPMEPFPLKPDSRFRIVTLMNEPACQVVLEDWFKDNPIEWVYFVDAFHVVISGRAEITYRNPPDWPEERTVIAEPGMMYLTPRGAHVKWRILSDEPFRHVVLDIPNAGYSEDIVGPLVGLIE
jgi:mannose-6-phosphate isomerase-like protein (cupin superfamily)